MKKNRIYTAIARKDKENSRKRKIFSFFFTAVLLTVLLTTFHTAFGKFLSGTISDDSASVAKFDVIITPPKDFGLSENPFEYYFVSGNEIKSLDFVAYNNGETDVVCYPHINNGIKYIMFVSKNEQSEFVIKTKETVNFQLFIFADGLSGKLKEAELFIDLRQV